MQLKEELSGFRSIVVFPASLHALWPCTQAVRGAGEQGAGAGCAGGWRAEVRVRQHLQYSVHVHAQSCTPPHLLTSSEMRCALQRLAARGGNKKEQRAVHSTVKLR